MWWWSKVDVHLGGVDSDRTKYDSPYYRLVLVSGEFGTEIEVEVEGLTRTCRRLEL